MKERASSESVERAAEVAQRILAGFTEAETYDDSPNAYVTWYSYVFPADVRRLAELVVAAEPKADPSSAAHMSGVRFWPDIEEPELIFEPGHEDV